MGVQYSVRLNNYRLDGIEVVIGASPNLFVRTGAQPANCAAADSGTLLVTIPLPADWMADASSATKAKSGTWSAAASGGSASTPGHVRIREGGSPDTCHLQADAAIGSGSVNFDGTITAGQTVTVSTFTITAGNQ